MTEVKRTFINPDQEIEARDRPGFTGIEQYANRIPEPGEIGTILVNRRYREQVGVGMHLSDGEPIERIFVR